MDNTHITRKVLTLAQPDWARIVGGVVFSLMLSGITGAIAWLVKPALDVVFVEKKYEYLQFLPAGVFLLFIIKGVAGCSGISYEIRGVEISAGNAKHII